MTSLKKLLANKHFWSVLLAVLLGYFLIMEKTANKGAGYTYAILVDCLMNQ